MNFFQRLVTSIIVITILTGSVSCSYHPVWMFIFPLMVIVAAATALWEYYQISKTQHTQPLQFLGICYGISYLIAVFLYTQNAVPQTCPNIVLACGFFGFFLYFFFHGNRPILNLAVSIFGITYIIIPLSYWIRINYFFHENGLQDGRLWIAYLIVVTKITDIGAYLFGKGFGKHRLATLVSPNKTIEGALGGMVFAIAASTAFPTIVHLTLPTLSFSLSMPIAILLGVSIGILAQVGDLMESLLKRDANIKDSNSLPGLGGILDMIDSLIFTSPLVYFVIQSQY